MAGFLTWLPDALRKAGGDVHVMPGAETRSSRRSGLTVKGVVWHHTVTSKKWLDGHVAALLRDGRRDLAGPLVQLGVERDGTIVVVALGRANHNGYGEWGNDAVGIEFYNDGKGEPLTDEQIAAGLLITETVLRHEGLHYSRTKAHRETDPKRKVDLLPSVLDMGWVRRQVAARLAGPPPAPPAPAPTVDSMKTIWHVTDQDKFFLEMPDGLVRLTHEEAYILDQENATVGVVKTKDAFFVKVHSGARAVSFSDAPKPE